MLMRSRGSIIVSAFAFTAIGWMASQTLGQSPTAYEVPRTTDGRPNLNGLWQALNSANWDIEEHVAQAAPYERSVGVYLAQPGGLGVVEGGRIPYKPEALQKKQQNFKTRLEVDALKRDIGDPEAKCFSAGVPRATYMPYPFQIVQAPTKILFAYEYAATPRVVRMGKVEPWPEYDSWMGDSIGRWEGDTLVVDVTAMNGKAWLDRTGNFMSETSHVVERYTRISPDHLMYEATIEDPNIYTRPWKMSMPLYRRIEKNAQLFEFQCVAFAEEYILQKYLKKPSSN